MLLQILYLLLLVVSGLVGVCVLVWVGRLILSGNWPHALSILVAGSLAGLVAIGLLILIAIAIGETLVSLPAGTYAAIFGVGFGWGSFAMAVSLGLWPFVKELVYQSRRWADRR